jgi:acyl-coenzyme A thioesterase PaaI-like protein
MSEMTTDEAQAFLAENFAPWINEMDLRFEEIGGGRVLVRIPFSPRLNRLGDIMCGQAMMAAADTAMVFAAVSAIGDAVLYEDGKPDKPIAQATMTYALVPPRA